VITPLTPIDLERATDTEIVAAYMRDGEDERSARAYLAILRGDTPPGAIAD